MRHDFLDAITQQKKTGLPFAVATVIRVEGSASARPGSRAIFDMNGQNQFGWVGGGCAERFVGEQSIEALSERHTRIVTADLDDEIFGLGIACGGRMDVFIEPIFPSEVIELASLGGVKQEAEFLASSYGWRIKWNEGQTDSLATPSTPLNAGASTSEGFSDTNLLSLLLPKLALAICNTRGRTSLRSLRDTKDLPLHFKPSLSANFTDQTMKRAPPLQSRQILIVGRSRITEALARVFTQLGWQVQVFGPSVEQKDYPGTVRCQCLKETYDELEFKPGGAVVIASHHAHDPEFVQKALRAGASYVGMVGSRKRALEVLENLGGSKKVEELETLPLYVPAGIDLDACNPDEIAFSIAVEILSKWHEREPALKPLPQPRKPLNSSEREAE